MPIETGSWKIVVNGIGGAMIISTSDPQGLVSGKLILTGGEALLMEGTWNEQGNELTFSVFLPPSPTSKATPAMVFTGYVFEDKNRLQGIQGGKVYTLAGTVQVSVNAPGYGVTATADQNEFGWYAQIGVE